MSKTSIIIGAVGGAILGVIIANYLATEKGKQVLDSASGMLKDWAGKATEYAKNGFANVQTAD